MREGRDLAFEARDTFVDSRRCDVFTLYSLRVSNALPSHISSSDGQYSVRLTSFVRAGKQDSVQRLARFAELPEDIEYMLDGRKVTRAEYKARWKLMKKKGVAESGNGADAFCSSSESDM